VRAITDASASVVQTYATDEFGIPDVAGTQGSTAQPMQYTGEQRDSESGLVYLRARLYDPQVGRFLQADPLRKSGPGVSGWNRYSYVGNNPVTFSDPSGLKAQT
jgi:RHS repeat-associated protein